VHECAVRVKDGMFGCSERNIGTVWTWWGAVSEQHGAGEESPRKVKTCVTGITLPPAALTCVTVTFTAT